ncbi:MAG TPA: hypothetical protein VGI87_03340 [Solirubrobacteraceae bacterium]|jgi:hypothetical protein
MGQVGKSPTRSVLAAVLVAGTALAAPGVASASSATTPPSQTQIQTALRHAKTSPGLWATVNVCNTKQHPGVIGIRAQMPALGFASTLRMRFAVDYFSAQNKSYKPVPGAIRQVGIGVQKTGLHQEGVMFSFPRHTGELRGTVRFQWASSQRVLGQAEEITTHGHPGADFGDPTHYSAKQCTIN